MALVEVTHIEDRTGPHGGRYWLLALVCGHVAARRQPRIGHGLLPVAHAGNQRMVRYQRRVARLSTYCAPRRVKCPMGCQSAPTRAAKEQP